VATLAFGLASLVPTVARAGPAVDGDFHYTTPAGTDPLRTFIEQGVILGIGYAQYATNKANEADWDVGTDWPGFRSKLLFSSASFDDNRFDTNWLTHPLAGFLYYGAARSNRLGILPSFLIAFASSGIWELVGEVREQIAINDVIATPVAGVALGETSLQIGNLLHRSRDTTVSGVLGWVFAPFKSAHDALDDVDPERADAFDDVGLAADVWHRFRAGTALGVTAQEGGRTELDARASLDSRIVALPDYGSAGRHALVFDSGEVTSLRLQAAHSPSRWVDLGVAAHVLPFGAYWQDVRPDNAGGLDGSSVIVGLDVGAEYSRHDYDRDGRRGEDRIALVTAGATVEHTAHFRRLLTRARLDVLGSFGGVDAYGNPLARGV
jgi:hypothetical protein